MDVIYSDGVRAPGATIANVTALPAGVPPPAETLAQHVLWEEESFPSFESATTVDAVAVCGVKGDGVTDDEPALAACLRKHNDVSVIVAMASVAAVPTHAATPAEMLECAMRCTQVFLPKGFFRLGRTLELNSHNRLVGLGQTLSVLMPRSAGLEVAAGRGQNRSTPQPLVRTAAGGVAVLAFVGIVSWWHLPVYTLHWRATAGLWRSNYEFRVCECLWLQDYAPPTSPCTTAIKLAVPKTLVEGTGSFVNYVSDEDILMTDHVNYRHLHVLGPLGNAGNASDRLRFYM